MCQEIEIAEQFDKHLNGPLQTWLLGAGISFDANIPLMAPLTEEVMRQAKEKRFSSDDDAKYVLDFIENDCKRNSHIEHYLTHLSDLISLAERSRQRKIKVGEISVCCDKLKEIHNALIDIIVSIVRWGHAKNEENEEWESGSPECSKIKICNHVNFIQAIFRTRRAGLDFIRKPVEFFTTNYDTLIEDSLALSCIEFQDGFIGGGVGFWNIENYKTVAGTKAIVSKLHGSVDWYRDPEKKSPLLRVRHGDTYPSNTKRGAVMIYPQATKYANTQRDPFAEIFQRFRHRLSKESDHVLLICGYSFGDEHINTEIELAMDSYKSQLTIVAFVKENSGNLPPQLQEWQKKPWQKRLFVASSEGLYWGSIGPVFPDDNEERDWWTFKGVSKLLTLGLPKDIQEAIS